MRISTEAKIHNALSSMDLVYAELMAGKIDEDLAKELVMSMLLRAFKKWGEDNVFAAMASYAKRMLH